MRVGAENGNRMEWDRNRTHLGDVLYYGIGAWGIFYESLEGTTYMDDVISLHQELLDAMTS